MLFWGIVAAVCVVPILIVRHRNRTRPTSEYSRWVAAARRMGR